jgi:hypothetical protein
MNKFDPKQHYNALLMLYLMVFLYIKYCSLVFDFTILTYTFP